MTATMWFDSQTGISSGGRGEHERALRTRTIRIGNGVLVISSSRTSSSGGRILSSRADNSSLVSSPASNSRGVSLVKHRSPVSSPASNSRGDNLPTASRVVSLRTVSRKQPGQGQPGQQQPWGQPQQQPPAQPWGQPGQQQAPDATQAWGQPPSAAPQQAWGATAPRADSGTARTSGTRLSRSRVPVRPGNQSGKSKKPLIFGAIGVLVVLAAVVVALVFGVFGKNTLDQSAAQAGVEKIVTESYGAKNVSNVQCPADQEVKSGNKFTCTLSIAGVKSNVTVTFVDDNGTYEGQPPELTLYWSERPAAAASSAAASRPAERSMFSEAATSSKRAGSAGVARESVVLRELNVRVANHSYYRQRSIKVSHCLW